MQTDRLELLRFFETWKQTNPQDQSKETVATAWRRFNLLREHPPAQDANPSPGELNEAFLPLLESVRDDVVDARCILLDGRKPPWTATNIMLEPGQEVSTFATGRLWRSRELDLWLGPQFGMWCRVGENTTVFNSTQATNTFTADCAAELYLATQYPGQFGDKSGRVQGSLWAYDKTDGAFAVIVVVWKLGAGSALKKMLEVGDPSGLVSTELARQERPIQLPIDWHFLWFLGASDIFRADSHNGTSCISCRTEGNVGILQKDVALPLLPDTVLEWDWLVSELPSRLREDTTVSHDYLSVAIEFENQRDLTYTWSWELPVDYGYWCPLPTWQDREFHVVIRSGTKELGTWLSEKRNVFADYQRYIDRVTPDRIVRIWLIAGSRWQRYKGAMDVKNMALTSSQGITVLN